MKKIFFAFIMASSALLCALSNESAKNPQEDSLTFNGLEFRRPCRHHHHSSSNDNNDNGASQAAYGSFYTEDSGTPVLGLLADKKDGTEDDTNVVNAVLASPIIDPGSPIVFNRISVATSNVTLQSNGAIFLTQPGDYLVNFGLAAFNAADSFFRVALALNGVNPQPGTNISIFSGDDLTSISTIIRVPVASEFNPAVLTVVNNGTASFTLSTPEGGGDVSAFITVDKLQDLPN